MSLMPSEKPMFATSNRTWGFLIGFLIVICGARFSKRGILLLYTDKNGWCVVSFESDPARLFALPNCSVYLGGFAGKDGDVIVVVFNRKDFVSVARVGNGGPLKKCDVPGRIVQTDGHMVLLANLGLRRRHFDGRWRHGI